MLDMNRLRVLHEVSRTGSFSAAARSLRITPSAVAQQISALERTLGVPVVARSPRGVRMTDPGRLLAEATTGVVADLAQVQRHLEVYSDGGVGRLAVATFASAGQTLLPLALAPLTWRSDVELTVHDAEVDESLPLLRDGVVDLAITCHFHTEAAPRAWRRDLDHTALLREEMFAVVKAGHPLDGRPEISLAELADDPWILGQSYCGEQVYQFCTAAGYEPRAACQSSDYTFAQTLIAAGVGVALIPALALSRHLPGISVLPLRPAPYRYIGVARRRERWTPPLAAELVELLKTASAELATPGVEPMLD
jgi:molybdate transport repressor ModE-like protein